MQDGLLSEMEVAESLRVPVGTVRWWRQTRELPFVKLGKHIRIRESDLELFVTRNRVGALSEGKKTAIGR